jgi:hypothetical protein
MSWLASLLIMRQHVLLAALRVALALGIFIALPFSHMQWGASYPADGQLAFGFIAIFTVIGLVAAFFFVSLGSLAQFLLRRRSPRFTVLVDLGLFLAFAGVLVYGGVTAKYNDMPPEPTRNEGAQFAKSEGVCLCFRCVCLNFRRLNGSTDYEVFHTRMVGDGGREHRCRRG